jgi:hypothetical protein
VAIIAPTLLASSGVMLAVYFTRRAHIRYEALNATLRVATRWRHGLKIRKPPRRTAF